MTPGGLGGRIRCSLIAAAVGWAAAMVATMPMQFAKIVANSIGGVGGLLWSMALGAAVWGIWTLAIVAGGWLLGFLPVILLVPEKWLLGHRRVAVALSAAMGWMVVLVEFEVWKLFRPYHSLEYRMFILYSVLMVVFPSVAAGVYLRLISAAAKTRGGPGSSVSINTGARGSRS